MGELGFGFELVDVGLECLQELHLIRGLILDPSLPRDPRQRQGCVVARMPWAVGGSQRGMTGLGLVDVQLGLGLGLGLNLG